MIKKNIHNIKLISEMRGFGVLGQLTHLHSNVFLFDCFLVHNFV